MNLARQANHHRRTQRPAEPAALDFVLRHDHVPDGFLQGDVTVGARRHIIFATMAMLTLLSRAQTWFVAHQFTFLSIRANVCSTYAPTHYIRCAWTYVRMYNIYVCAYIDLHNV